MDFQLVLFLILVCVSTSKCDTEGISIDLIKMKSPLQTMAHMNIHPSKVEALLMKEQKTSNTSVPLYKFLDMEFYGNVMVGSPGQNFKVIFDTAWANSWIPSSLCSSFDIACEIHNQYNAAQSNTHFDNGTTIVIPLGGYNLTGRLSTDMVHIGKINITDQTFAEMSYVPWAFVFSKADGVFGLAFDSYAIDNVTPFFYNMLKQKTVQKPIFSFYMNRDPSSKRAGTLFFGGVEERHYTGNFTFAKITKKGYWQFRMDSLKVKGYNMTFCRGGCDVIADTSTNAILGPDNEISLLNQKIGAKKFFFGRYVVECGSMGKLPVVTFTISGRPFLLKAKDYIQQISWGGIMVCMSAFASSGSSLWTLGGAFLSRFYVQFDMGNYKIGFADALL